MKMSQCEGCAPNYFETIARFYNNNQEALDFMREHGALPSVVKCPSCNTECSFRSEQKVWRCRHSVLVPHSKKRRACDFSVSDYKDTFMHGASLAPWKVLLFVNHWLSKHWDHATVVECLKISLTTSYDYRTFCYHVTQYWFDNQQSVGGPGEVVEVDKTDIVHKKSEWTKETSQIWLFGGVERGTKRRFVVPLVGPVGDWQEHSTVLPLVKRFILPGTVVISDQWGAYHGLKDQGYTHYVINHSQASKGSRQHFDKNIHTNNIEGLWKELRGWVKGPNLKSSNLYQELAKHLFTKTYKNDLVHQFFVHAGELFPHQGGQQRVHPFVSSYKYEDFNEEEDEEF